jgi:SOS response regulatory protein OraA/RecX
VELDGTPWRTLPLVAVIEAGLSIGVELDRARARAVGRALRRERAQGVALRALGRRDHSRASLEARLERARVPPADRDELLTRAERSGLIDDGRFAERRAWALAERGSGDRLVVDDLVRSGVDEHVARDVVSRMEPESVRAARIVAARGMSPKTVRYLAARGFGEDTLAELVAEVES